MLAHPNGTHIFTPCGQHASKMRSTRASVAAVGSRRPYVCHTAVLGRRSVPDHPWDVPGTPPGTRLVKPLTRPCVSPAQRFGPWPRRESTATLHMCKKTVRHAMGLSAKGSHVGSEGAAAQATISRVATTCLTPTRVHGCAADVVGTCMSRKAMSSRLQLLWLLSACSFRVTTSSCDAIPPSWVGCGLLKGRARRPLRPSTNS